jgi:putative transposase
MVRGIEKIKIFLNDRDRLDLLKRIEEGMVKTGVRIYAWVLMPNHFHLLVRTGHVPLSAFLRRMLTGYAVSFNHRHERVGHLFQNRYKSILVEEEPYLLELVRYIHLNPIRKKTIANLNQLNNYPWSGHTTLMGKRNYPWQDTEEVLARFGKREGKARRLYREFMAEGLEDGKRPDLTGGGLIRSMGGWQRVKEIKRGREKWASDERILGGTDFVEEILREVEKARPRRSAENPETIMARLIKEFAVGRGFGIAEVKGGSRRRNVVGVRDEISYRAVCEFGMLPTKVAAMLGVSRQSVLRGVEKGKGRLEKQTP